MRHRVLTKDPRTGTYYARIQVDGVRKKFFFSKNHRKAEHELRQLEKDLESGTKSFAALANPQVDRTRAQDITIQTLTAKYLSWVEANRAKGTLATKRYMLAPFVEQFGECMVSDLNHITLSRFHAWAKSHRGRSENGGNRHMREVKTLLRWGEQIEICECPVRRFPALREAPAKTKKFTDDELVRLMQHVADDFRDLILFGLLTGLRPQELRSLRREHLRCNGSQWAVVLERHKTSISAEVAQPRCVPLAADAVAIIEKQIAAHPWAQFIFLNDHAQSYTAGGFRQRLERACIRAGLEKKPPYALRHYFGTNRAAHGLNQAILAQIMGHTTIRTTSRYVAVIPEYHQKAMDAMEEDLSSLLSRSEPDISKSESENVILLPSQRKTS